MLKHGNTCNGLQLQIIVYANDIQDFLRYDKTILHFCPSADYSSQMAAESLPSLFVVRHVHSVPVIAFQLQFSFVFSPHMVKSLSDLRFARSTILYKPQEEN